MRIGDFSYHNCRNPLHKDKILMLRHKPRNCIPWLLAEATKLSWVVAWAFFILLEREEAINDQRSYRRLILDTAYPILYFPFSSGLIKRNLVLMDQMGIMFDRVF